MFLKIFHFDELNIPQMPLFLFSLHYSFTWSRQSYDQRFEFRMAEVSLFNKALMINVKAQLMERDAIYVQSLLHL